MARVYLARDLRYDKFVAIKKLNPELSAALGPERFLREIDIVAHLNHPHILPLLDSGEDRESLYYVMPYIAGESLRHRLRRETQLPIGDAIAIARDVARALNYAHRQGIVHRDIKPENILMSEGLAIVADFGIARAISLAAEDDRITQSGVSPGTPPYMSPEQASGEDVDGRSDIYALGCVLYELLAGQPPFTGPSTQAILARHLADPVPPLRTVRKTISVGLEQVVFKALEKVPADRFGTAAEFVEALSDSRGDLRRHQWRGPAVVSAAIATIFMVWLASRGWSSASGAIAVDTTRFAVFPFVRESGLTSTNEDQLLQDAMLRWTGITMADRPRLLDELSHYRNQPTGEEAASAAREVGAGRYVESQIARVGDSLRIHSAVYNALVPGPPLQESVVKVGSMSLHSDQPYARIADDLLFGGGGPGGLLDHPLGTKSRPARQALANGLDAMYTWDLRGADSAFTAAVHYDPQFAMALLWLTMTRWWNADPAATWQSSAERASSQRAQLAGRDRALSDGLLALARGESDACAIWRRATKSIPEDFVNWYGLATCLTGDRGVLRDPRSPSGWSFRSSYHEATRAYVRAFQLLPSIHKSLAGDAFLSVRRQFWTSGDGVRLGIAIAPDTGAFLAYASWNRDSLAFYPFRAAQLVRPATTNAAVRHERELFRDVAMAWVSEYPRSADALYALALALDMVGNPTAVDTLRRARAAAVTPSQRIRTAGAEIWLRIKRGVPGDLSSLRAGRALADTLLRDFPPGSPEPLLLASVAILTGRAGLAAAHSAQVKAAENRGVPPALAAIALPLTSFAALGGPADSLRYYEQRVQTVIDGALEQSQRSRAREEWLVRPATLAFPEYQFQSLSEYSGLDDLLDALTSSARGDTDVARRMFAELRSRRRFIQPSDLSLDVLYPEAWLLASLGDDRPAIAWLDPTFAALPATAPEMFTDLPRAGALVRAVGLRADLSARVGDTAGAARWARIVTVLWSNADPFLQPIVRHMTDLEH